MIGLFRQRRTTPDTVGIAFAGDGAAVVRLERGGRDAPPRIDAAAWLPATDGATLAERIDDWVRDHDLERRTTVAVLAPGDYQVFQIEAPNVPPAEMNEAAAWRVRDLVDFPLDQAVIDTFDPPASAQRGERQVNVVVARRAVVDDRAGMLRAAGLAPRAIDIPELAQRNVCRRLPETRGGHALLALDVGDGLLTVYRDGEIFLARTLDTAQADLAGGDQGSVDSLLLEVQRSFDYFESALSQPPLGALYIFPPSDDAGRVAQAVIDNLGNVDCRSIGLGDIGHFPGPADAVLDRAPVLHAVGAALREQESAR